MGIVIKDPFMDRLIAKGETQGKASMLLLFLESRFEVPKDRREQVERCTDAGRIEKWFRQALSAVTLDQVFTT